MDPFSSESSRRRPIIWVEHVTRLDRIAFSLGALLVVGSMLQVFWN